MDKFWDEDDKFKTAVFRRAIEMAPYVDRVTLGPNAVDVDPSEDINQNIENSQNKINTEETKSILPNFNLKNKSRLTFSIEKIRHERELLRREEVRKAVEKRRMEMEAFKKELQNYKTIREQELELKHEREMAEEDARLKAEDERAALEYELRKKQEAELQDQRLQELRDRLTKETEESMRRMEALEKIQNLRINFEEHCKEIVELAKTIKEETLMIQVISPYTIKLQELNEQIETLHEIGQAGQLTNDDLTSIEEIMKQTEEICNHCKVEVPKINELYDEELRKQKEILAQNQARADLIESKPQTQDTANTQIPVNGMNSQQNSHTTTPDHQFSSADIESKQIYINASEYLERYDAVLKPFLDANTSPKFHIECNKTITFLIKGIAPTSGQHLRGVINDFRLLFEGRNPSHLTQIPQGLAFYKNLAAERFIDQVEESFLGRNPKWIYAVAAVIVSLWGHYPDFGDVLLAHMRMRCPYVIPVLLPHLPGQSVEAFFESRGYKYEDDKLEEDKDFIQRMANILKLYAAIIVTKVPGDIISSHPHGLRNAWKWLAIMLNIEPQKDTTVLNARLIKDMLEIVGNAMWSAYPTQFPKLLQVLAQQYFPLLLRHESEKNCEISLLKDFLYNAITKGCIPPPEGLLPPTFW